MDHIFSSIDTNLTSQLLQVYKVFNGRSTSYMDCFSHRELQMETIRHTQQKISFVSKYMVMSKISQGLLDINSNYFNDMSTIEIDEQVAR